QETDKDWINTHSAKIRYGSSTIAIRYFPLEKRTSSTEIRGIVEPYVIFCNFFAFLCKNQKQIILIISCVCLSSL
ncbi:hypothetical protein NX020_27350, partial [Escherichia coli]|nr:hypothetical protein [Escherichia coli]